MRKATFSTALCCLLCLLSGMGQAQDERPTPTIPETASTPAGFAPADWRVETAVEGDLSKSGHKDAAIVLATGKNDYDEKAKTQIYVKRVLVLALRGTDGKLHRSAVSNRAVLNGDEGGVLGDPFQGIAIEHGTVVVTHYGGSRDRWAITTRYRYQDGAWKLIGLTDEGTDTLDPDHFDKQDINLSTGTVAASRRGETNQDTHKKSPLISGSYRELEALPVTASPSLEAAPGAWGGYNLHLQEREDVSQGRTEWRGKDDLSARMGAVTYGDSLYLWAEVTESKVTAGDRVRLVTKSGQEIAPTESKVHPEPHGYVVEAKYALKSLAKGLSEPQRIDTYTHATKDDYDPNGLPVEIAVEVIAVDRATGKKPYVVLSTRRLGSPYMGSLHLYPPGILTLSSW